MKFKERIHTEYIVLHCSATSPQMDIGVEAIDRWHRDRGWLAIGYHYVITRDGDVQEGRPVEAMGAHVKGQNSISVGICMVGGVMADNKTPDDNFTAAQWGALKVLCDDLLEQYPNASIVGHNKFSPKACPSFDWRLWVAQEFAGEETPRDDGDFPERTRDEWKDDYPAQ